MTNARGVTIHVGSVGFLHVSDVLVTFASGPIESVRVDDVLYTGQMVTLLTWLYEFASKRLRGVRLRDGLPVATERDEPRSDPKSGGGRTAPESEASSRVSEAEETARRGAVLRQTSLAAATPADRAGDAGESAGGESGGGFGAASDQSGHAAFSAPESGDFSRAARSSSP